MKKSTIITLKIAVLGSVDPATVAEQVKKGVQFINPIAQPEIVELSAEKVDHIIFERNEAE